MRVTAADVAAIAALARLRLDPGEADRMADQLTAILDHMDELRTVAVAGVPPFAIAAADVAPPRSDDIAADPLHREPGAMAPAWQHGFFTVPRLAAQRTDR
jgi:aspartyl-tRNA(Asn)/glutamyl-tRNA(Gln) amidotransferase subunit C